jgi:hypothetical protein
MGGQVPRTDLGARLYLIHKHNLQIGYTPVKYSLIDLNR